MHHIIIFASIKKIFYSLKYIIICLLLHFGLFEYVRIDFLDENIMEPETILKTGRNRKAIRVGKNKLQFYEKQIFILLDGTILHIDI